MAYLATLTSEEKAGLGVAVVAHVALAVALAWHATREPAAFTPPERIVVSLATDVSLESTAPDPSADPAAAYAPTIDELPQPEEVVVEKPVEPRPQPVPQPTKPPKAVEKPKPKPTPTATKSQAASGSRLGKDFLEGSSDNDGRSGSPAATFGRAEQAALSSAITRQLKPHWSAPSGVDADQLVTVLAWELNADGSLKGQPRVVSQSGITDSNRPQAGLHAERAIRAVQLAAPFNLPDQFYDKWSRIREWRFDRRL